MDILGPVASAAQLAELVVKGWRGLIRAQPEYHHFWKRLERTVNQYPHDLPVEQIRDHYWLLPEFIGWACGLIRGERAKLDLIEASFRAELEQPDGSRFNKDEMVAKLLDLVRDAAARAVTDMADAFLQQTGLLEGRLGELQDSVVGEVERSRAEDRAGEAHIGEQLSKNSMQLDELSAGMRELRELAVRKVEMVPEAAIRSSEVDEIELDVQATATGSASLASLAASGDSGGSVDDLLDALDKEDTTGAAALRDMLSRGGVLEVVASLRSREGPEDDGLAFLVTIARIAARVGAFAEAESAYIWASDIQGLDDRTRTKQLVRAAHMAQVHDERRFRQLLERAKRLVPDHPSIAIAEARSSSDAEWMLERVRDVEPESEQERALLHITRAQAHLALENEKYAERELAVARQADPQGAAVKEFEGIVLLIRAKRRVSEGLLPDDVSLVLAAETLNALRPELEQQGRWDESAQIAARAIEALALASEFEKAISCLDSVKRVDQLGDEARLDLAEAAMVARRTDLVLTLVRESDPAPAARVLRADALSFSENAAERQSGIDTLIELIEVHDPHVKNSAAFGLLGAAATFDDVEWNDRADEIVTEIKPLAAAVFRAGYVRAHGDLQGAEAILLRHADQPEALRLLRDLSAQQDDWEKARDRSRRILQLGPSPQDRLADADILRRLGLMGDARDAFLATARDESVPSDARERAFAASAEITSAAEDHDAARAIAEEWRAAFPESLNAAWNVLYAMTRLSAWGEAYSLIQLASPKPNTLRHARLAALIYNRAAPTEEAIRQIDSLSSLFAQPDEQLEGMLIVTALEAQEGGVELPEELVGEVRQRFQLFPERFPDSTVMWAIPAPQTAEEFDALMREMHGPSAEAQRDVMNQIVLGQAPVNALAVVSPYGQVTTAWGRLDALPLGYATSQSKDEEREAARAAVGGAAIWDPSSIVVVGGLGFTIERAVRAALPGSLIAHETRDDADVAAMGFSENASAEAGFDPDTGRAFLREVSEEDKTRERYRVEGVLRIATELKAHAASGAGTDERLAEMLADEHLAPGWRPLLATLALAKRMKRPVFSDDRWIREAARAFELKAFGTLGLLDALAVAGLVTDAQRRQARRRLAASGGWGVMLTSDEMRDVAVDAGWDLTSSMAGALRDRAAWRADVGMRWVQVVGFLQAVCEQRDDRLQVWVRRALDAAMDALPEFDVSFLAQAMLVVSWDLDGTYPVTTEECFRSLVREVRTLPFYLCTPGYDPLVGAANQILGVFENQSKDFRYALLGRLLRRLPPEDRAAVSAAFVV